MKVNEVATQRQLDSLTGYVDELNNFKRRINTLSGELKSNWSAEEVVYINRALTKVNEEINDATEMVNTLKLDISRALSEIQQLEQNK